MTAIELRRILLNSEALILCEKPERAKRILESKTEWGDADCAFIFAKNFDQNICIHMPLTNGKMSYMHITVNDNGDYIHLHLQEEHFTPYLPKKVTNDSDNESDADPSDDSEDSDSPQNNPTNRKQQENQANHDSDQDSNPSHSDSDNYSMDSHIEPYMARQRSSEPRDTTLAARSEPEPSSDSDDELLPPPKTLARCIVHNARPPREKPPWAPPEGEAPPPLPRIRILNQHPFRFSENLVYFTAAEGNWRSEIQEALIERGYVAISDLENKERKIGEIEIFEKKGIKMLNICIKNHTNEKVFLKDIRKCLKTLKNLVLAQNISSFAIIRDLSILSLLDWNKLIDQFDKIFEGQPIIAVFYKNNIPVPPVDDRLKVIRDYHHAPLSGHRGINKTYNKMARDYYWRGMRADIRQAILRCEQCQTNKHVRKKTRLPLVISHTPTFPFDQISLDFYGPLKKTVNNNRYILTVQDCLTKFIVLTPVQRADAKEVATAFIEKVFSFYGIPVAINTDQGKHFKNKLLEELAEIFGVDKFFSTTYHPQSNGSIERMHFSVTEYLRKYIKDYKDWDNRTSLCQLGYNTTIHESTDHTPHELLFGYEPRTPSSLPQNHESIKYTEYFTETKRILADLQTKAAMNLVQSKLRSKYYYDQHLNVQHFREGEKVYLLKEPALGKFHQEYVGPYEIIKVYEQTNNVELQIKNTRKVVHIDKIKRATSDLIIEPNTELAQISGQH